jgi:hypothetical protein
MANVSPKAERYRARYDYVERQGIIRTVGDFVSRFQVHPTSEVLVHLGERLNTQRWVVKGAKLNGGDYNSEGDDYRRNKELGQSVTEKLSDEPIIVREPYVERK